jgi:trehalose/maltose transport system substrate-binding protein
MKIAGICGILLLSIALGCAKPAHKPVTLTYLDVEWDTPDVMPGLARDLQDFTRETGIQVQRLPRPDGALNQLALWRELLQKGSAGPDILSIDVIWTGVLAQYLKDLKPDFSAELSHDDPVLLASYAVGDEVFAVPHHAYVGVLFYRPDLLRAYGYREPPKTWSQLETMSARIQAGERAKGRKDFWGYVWEGAVDEDLTCGGLEWQVSDGGGRIIENDKTISVNNPRAISAWQRAAHWIGSISPPGTVAYGKWDANNVWGSGRAAFLRSWQGDYSLITRGWPFSGSPPVTIEAFGVTSLPGGPGGRVGALGGNGLAVSRASAHPQEALQLIRFLLRKDAQLMAGSAASDVPKGLELYELPAILKAFPQLQKSGESRGGLVARPSVAAGAKYERVTRAYIQAVHAVLTGEKAASVAAGDLEKELVAITGFPTGPPSK